MTRRIRDDIDEATGQKSLFANVKKYLPDADMSWHHDETENWRPGTGVGIISFGATVRELLIGKGPKHSRFVGSKHSARRFARALMHSDCSACLRLRRRKDTVSLRRYR